MSLRPVAGLRPVRVLGRRGDRRGRRAARARRLRHRRASSRPATARPRHLRDRRRDALFSRRRAVPGLGRAHRPARRRLADARRLDRSRCWTRYPDETARLPGPHGPHHARPRARHQPVPRRARRELSERSRPRAARSTCCPSRRAPRDAVEAGGAAASSRPRATGGSRRRCSRHTELFARGVGEATDIVQKEMYTFEDGGGRSLTLRPEGTAPVCRAYLEHGMHKLAQPVKLWYLGAVLPPRAPAGRPLPPVLAGRRRGDRLRGPGGRRRDDRAAARRCSTSSASRERAPAAREPRHARHARAGYRERAAGLPARARATSSPSEVRGAHRPQPAARVRRRPPRHAARSWQTRRACSTTSTPRTASTSPQVRALLDARRPRLRASTRRSCAASTTTRARSSSSPPTRSAPSRASAAAGATTG